jgi:tetratricopeptide (TPR) repeat protein
VLWAGVVAIATLLVLVFLAGRQGLAWYHLHAARSELQRSHNPQAVRHLQSCLRIWPHDPDVLLLAARAARCAGSYDEAEVLLEKYQQARGLDDAGTLEQLLLSAERNVDSVETVCWRHIEQDHPAAREIQEALTRGYLRQYRLVEARMCLQHWRDRAPEDAEAWCLQGRLHLDYERMAYPAIENYRHALELDPDHEDARLGLAVALLETKNYQESAQHLARVAQCQPDNLRVQVGLAECQDFLGNPAEAYRLVEGVLAQHPDYAQALALRGWLALESGQPEEAETWLRRAKARNPADHQARYNLILCLRRNGKEDEAERDERELKEWEDDLKRFNEIVTQDMVKRPHDPAVHCALGQLLLRSGQRDEGLRWLFSALQLDANYEPARKALAEYAHKPPGQPQQGLRRSMSPDGPPAGAPGAPLR